MKVHSTTSHKRVSVVIAGFIIVATLATTVALATPHLAQKISRTPSHSDDRLPLAPSAVTLTRLVSTAGTDAGDCSLAACAMIAYAIGQAAVGDTINIAAGTYTQSNILVDKNLTINGAGAAKPIKLSFSRSQIL